VLGPSLAASFVYVFVFTGWTLYISLSDSSLLPTYGFVGLDNYASLWANRRWNIAYNNLFLFSGFYIVGSMAVGLLLAILIDQRVRAEAVWRTIFLYPLAVSFIVTGTVWSWLYNPTDGIQAMVRGLGWTNFSFALASDRHYAIYAVIITGVWQSSGFAMALFLAGLRSVDSDLVKAAQIDGASTFRIYRKVLLPTIAPIFLAVAVIQIQFAIKTFDLVAALTKGGPGISTTFPAIYVYDLMFQRGQIGEGAAAAIMMLAALAVVLMPYSFWVVWRRRKEAGHG
ncbi:sugar ABC transporter permease, partial [Mesorhizobium sp. B2-3-12]|uniref:carbohydrate ABC transporter permease n=1 Tax=Mesorhizobium sp. B2-3-12 TaxID=2589952 RepID=UPI001FED412A